MCRACFYLAGAPRTINKNVRKAASLVEKIYEWSLVGGNAHVVVDDWNCEDDHIDRCLNNTLSENVHGAGKKQLAVERAALKALRKLSFDERITALALKEGIISE